MQIIFDSIVRGIVPIMNFVINELNVSKKTSIIEHILNKVLSENVADIYKL